MSGTRSVPKRTIVFAISALAGGGAERALCNVLTGLETRFTQDDVHLVLLDDEPEAYAVPAYVTKHTLDGRGRFPRSTLQLFGLLRRLKPDICIGYLPRANCGLVLCAGILGFRCIISERNYTPHAMADRRMERLLVRALYPRADTIISVSEGVKKGLVDGFRVRAERVETIYNMVNFEQIEAKGQADPEIPLPASFVVAVGRLVAQKNFDQLITAYADAGLKEDLVIIGEGPDRPLLEDLIRTKGVAGRVHLPGFVANPFAVVARARFLVSASAREGFPNALAEALALRCPVVATDCNSGPAEILANMVKADNRDVLMGDYGILVPENAVGHLSEAMRRMADPATRDRYRAMGRQRAEDLGYRGSLDRYWTVINA